MNGLREINEGREHRIEVELPYSLTWDDLHLEEKFDGIFHPLQVFVEDFMFGANPEEILRVCIALIALRMKYPSAPFEQCLETAIIYERG